MATTPEADMIATDELAVTLRWREGPKMAYAVIAPNAVTSQVSGGMPARPAYAIATGTITPQLTIPAMASKRRSALSYAGNQVTIGRYRVTAERRPLRPSGRRPA